MTKFLELFFGNEHLIKIGSTLYLILASVYDVREDVTMLRKEHGLLLLGLAGLVKVGVDLYEKLDELREGAEEFR